MTNIPENRDTVNLAGFRPKGAFPFYMGDFLASTRHLSDMDRWRYFCVLEHMWKVGGLVPEGALEELCLHLWDDRTNCKRFRNSLANIQRMLTLRFGFWQHPRVIQDLEKAQKRRASNAKYHHKRGRDQTKTRQTDHEQDHILEPSVERERIEEAPPAPPPSPSPEPDLLDIPDNLDRREYAWRGDVIRLNAEHFEQWERSFEKLHLPAELTALDAWLASLPADARERKSWFMVVSGALNKRNRDASKPPPKRREIYGV